MPKKKKKSGADKERDFEAAAARAQSCAYPGCPQHSTLYLLLCEHCKQRFCANHQLPEVHGCDEKAKEAEKKQFREQKRAEEPMNEAQHELFKQKLHQKIQQQQSNRQIHGKKK
ncbi:MAG: hypothetical protein EZS28_018967 [Streblomastix strix]|uniref:AN1-type domain-containing protein n=1 Tax=Streblomastix strix TaxID=222440 RepID=A0A5J4VSB2_9EUKA|nr:MAG: hypothetical protein EZS28_018967 [Streblomastix strix]